MNIIVSIKCNDVGKILHSGVHGSNVDGGFNTPWKVECHFYRDVQSKKEAGLEAE